MRRSRRSRLEEDDVERTEDSVNTERKSYFSKSLSEPKYLS